MSHSFIDFSTAVSDVQLEHLAQACQPATFGVEQKDVLDESYRKAEKMDAINLSTNFNSNNTGILHAICGLLLKNTESPIRVELHKLNVYGMQKRFFTSASQQLTAIVGPGSFFKSHVDTPKGCKMIGFLVVVLPTKHEGGSFSLRHHGREWIFNSADIVSPQNSESPRAAFVAFFGDVEHEVSVVKSGYRVTLTYNLYFGDDKSTIVPSTTLRITEAKIKKSLLTLLNDEKFLPDGGLLGIGLTYQYPTNKNINLDELIESLKGTDAAIKRACDSLSLKASLKIVYNSSEFDGVACLVDKLELNDQVEEDMPFHLQETANGLLVFDSNMEPLSEDELARYGYDGMDLKPISWLRPLTERNKIETPYVRYGNEEATLDYVYGNICLVIEVETSEDRKIYL